MTNREYTLKVRLTEEERQQLFHLCDQSGRQAADLVRAWIRMAFTSAQTRRPLRGEPLHWLSRTFEIVAVDGTIVGFAPPGYDHGFFEVSASQLIPARDGASWFLADDAPVLPPRT